jgi:Trk K+ transport system NAD-binding subunit
MHMDADTVLLQVELSEDSPLAYHSLAEVGLGRDLGVQVLSIVRSPQEITSPRGADVLLPLDQLVVVVPSKNVQTLISLMKGRVIDGEV